MFVWSWFRLMHGARARGAHFVPRSGPVIFAPNHQTYYDPPLVACFTSRLLTYFAKDYLFRVPVLKQLITALGAFPVKPGSLRSSFETARRILEHGGALVMFPEGTRTRDGRIGPLQDGVARLALLTGAAIVPVSLFGGWEAWPRTRKVPRLCRPLRVIYHPPIFCERTEDRAELRRGMAQITARLERLYHRAWRHRHLALPDIE
ncbi:MAG: lysophospholipid acyltransferase family protein [Candidatus Sumerlaeia bacterium]